MTDREKVIECLEKSKMVIEKWVPMFEQYNTPSGIDDAIALLKEQEPQLVLNIGEQISCKSGSCPKCGKMLNTTCNKRYCGDCGQEVTWE